MGRRLSRALLDTSILIGAKRLPAETLPERSAISVVTVGELVAGVELAPPGRMKEARESRLKAVRSTYAALPVDDSVARKFGELLAWARLNRRSQKASDLLIAATAAATGRELITLDRAQAGLAESADLAVSLIGG